MKTKLTQENAPRISPKYGLARRRGRGYSGSMKPKFCPDCDGGDVLSRREFLHTTMTGMATLSALPLAATAGPAARAAVTASSGKLVAMLYQSLSQGQRKG